MWCAKARSVVVWVMRVPRVDLFCCDHKRALTDSLLDYIVAVVLVSVSHRCVKVNRIGSWEWEGGGSGAM